MSRFDITIGLLASLGTIAVMAVYGARESARMEASSTGWESRSIETGAALFDLYCSVCHGSNAAGLDCPPLDETSGLHGGDIGPGVACRLEEVGWNSEDPYGYVVSVIQAGRQYSTRPYRYPGPNRLLATATNLPVGSGTPTPKPALPVQAMPAWSQDFGGPLRPDQISDIARYIVAFRSALPEDKAEAIAFACDEKIRPDPLPTATATSRTTATSPALPGGTGTAAGALAAGTGTPARTPAGTPTP